MRAGALQLGELGDIGRAGWSPAWRAVAVGVRAADTAETIWSESSRKRKGCVEHCCHGRWTKASPRRLKLLAACEAKRSMSL